MSQHILTQLTQPSCGVCRTAIPMLKGLGAHVEFHDVTEMQSAGEMIRELGYRGTPVYVVLNESGNLVDKSPEEGLPIHWSGNRIDYMKRWAKYLTPGQVQLSQAA